MQSKRVLDLRLKRVKTVFFCLKHCPPYGFLKHANDIHEIREFFDPSLSFMKNSIYKIFYTDCENL